MVEVRLSSPADIDRQKQIWKNSFGDDDSYIDFFYDNFYKPENVMVLLEEGKIASMTVGFPVRLSLPDGTGLSIMYLYAFATDAEYRGKGYGSRLMGFIDEHLEQTGFDAAAVVPGSEGLFDYYRRLGFKEAFFISEKVIPSGELPGWPSAYDPERVNGGILSATPPEYNIVRNRMLSGSAFMQYTDSMVEYQKGLSLKTGADIYNLWINGIEGCAVVENTGNDTVLVKELLLPEGQLDAGLSLIADILPAERYILRQPVFYAGYPGNRIRPFGMIKSYGSDFSDLSELQKDSYLAFAFD